MARWPVLLGIFSISRCSLSFKIQAMEHDIQQVTSANFDGVVGKFRDHSVAAVWFFKDDNADDEKFLADYNKVGKAVKGMAKVTAVNCNDEKEFCKQYKVAQTPTVMMFPINPMPAYVYDGKLETNSIVGRLSKMIPDYTTKLTKDTADKWLSKDSSKPKVVLFSKQKAPPAILRALSSDSVFVRTAKFGFVTEEDTDLMSKFEVTKLPTVLMQRKQGKDKIVKEVFTGELNYQNLRKWVNPYIESGMGDKIGAEAKADDSSDDSNEQPWLTQEVPELNEMSSAPVCFGGESLCIIYLKEGAADAAEVKMLEGVKKKTADRKDDRGNALKFMWLNVAVEKGYKDLFKPDQLPSVVIFNPYKRLRFVKLEGAADEAVISGLIDKVLGGEASFKAVPGQKLPAWAAKGKQEL